jgi:hypothetical protein
MYDDGRARAALGGPRTTVSTLSCMRETGRHSTLLPMAEGCVKCQEMRCVQSYISVEIQVSEGIRYRYVGLAGTALGGTCISTFLFSLSCVREGE